MSYPSNMPKQRGKQTLLSRVYSVARSIAAPVPAGGDPVPLTDENYDPGAAVSAQGFETLVVGVEVVNGTGQEAVVLEPLFYDVGASDGSRWRRRLVGAAEGTAPIATPVPQQTPALSAGQDCELRVDGWALVFLRIVSVTGAQPATALNLLARPGRPSLALGIPPAG
jgi:hypothetical protein